MGWEGRVGVSSRVGSGVADIVAGFVEVTLVVSLRLPVSGFVVCPDTPEGVESLTEVPPICGRTQAQVIKIKTAEQIMVFFMLSPSR
jgi:hypothetical protein